MADTLTVENHVRIYDDKYGYYVTVRPSSDGLNLCEIAYNEGSQSVKEETVITVPWFMARILGNALLNNPEQQEHKKE